MVEQIVSLIVIALFLLVSIIGLIEFIFRQAAKREAAAPSAALPAGEDAPPPGETLPAESQPPAGELPSAEPPPPPGAVEIARLSRDPAGNLLVEMDGQRYRSVAELNEARRERLLAASSALQDWLAPQPASGDLPPRMPLAPPPEAAEPPSKAAPRASLFKIIEQALATDVPSLPPYPASVAAQVDLILQRLLQGTPLAERGIRLSEKPDHSILVQVGLARYDSVEAVPEDDIRSIIKAAVAEWANQAK